MKDTLENAKIFLDKKYPKGVDNTNTELSIFFSDKSGFANEKLPDSILYWRFNRKVYSTTNEMFYELMEKY